MIITGLFYVSLVSGLPVDAPPIAQLGPLIPYVLMVIVGSIIVQITLSVWMPHEANSAADEREQPLINRAGHWSGILLSITITYAAIQYLCTGQGNILFQWIVGSLILAQFAEYAFQVFLLRYGR
ncbi:MAG: hypothetical protein KTR25_02705 [Myxococcales bacterium]|nr:hypothetical protein [Myxococcales bacterium]